VAETLVKISGKKIQIRYDLKRPEGDQARSAHFGKARRLLGWKPRVSLLEGLTRLYGWIRQEKKVRG
jgi:GDP-D-mannose 3',5'-epimerase